jgi:5,10-methylenetetrahydromethanopterin reductase
MEFGITFASSFDAVGQAQLAEALGFSSVGFYDSPALEPDVWITIANVVQATEHISVGTEVLVPHLRHPMVQASAIATIEHLAPGRLYVGVGTGFTGRMAMGRPPLTWASVRQFLVQVKGLLAGELVEIDGAITQMLHPPAFASARPLHVPFLVAANGPKGIAVARELGDGLIYGADPTNVPRGFATLKMEAGGIVLCEGETAASSRVVEAARIAFPLRYHLAYEGFSNPPVQLGDLPYGADWLEALEGHPSRLRHLVVHSQHMVGLNDHDKAFMDRHPDAVAAFMARTIITPAQLRDRIEARQAAGATSISAFSDSGADWASAMRAFARAVGL